VTTKIHMGVTSAVDHGRSRSGLIGSTPTRFAVRLGVCASVLRSQGLGLDLGLPHPVTQRLLGDAQVLGT
jgi:hypothetical protein